jgi:hypothetical protein
MSKEQLLQKIEKVLPEIFAEKAIPDLLPGWYSNRHLSNLRSKGLGPESFKLGRRTMYCKDDFLDWLKDRLEAEDEE